MSRHEDTPTPPSVAPTTVPEVPTSPPELPVRAPDVAESFPEVLAPTSLDNLQDAYVGSPMYEVISEHGPALVSLLAMWGLFLWLRRRKSVHLDSYYRLDLVGRLLAWLLAITGVGHLTLILTHEPSFYSALYLFGGIAPLWMLTKALSGNIWRRTTALVLLGLLGGYGLSMLAGEPPDQFGLALKLVELAALVIVVRPRGTTRRKRLTTTAAVLIIALLSTTTSWIGAFSSGGGHHLGDTPPPGFMIPVGDDREPSATEAARAEELVHATTVSLQKYQDLDIAREAGFDVENMQGRDAHADNKAFKNDDHFFDPERPETLVYAIAPSGTPVILGAMYQMDEIGVAGPAIGGPLTVWHAHDHVCFSVLPLSITGFVSPLGQCPLGTVTMPITNEMLHIWILPGIEDPFGDIDGQWLDDYLSDL